MTERFKIKINIRNSDGDGDTSAMTETTAERKSGIAKTVQRSRRFLGMEVAIVGIAVLGALIAIALTPAVDTEVAKPEAEPAAVGSRTTETAEGGSAPPAREASPDPSASVSLQTSSSQPDPGDDAGAAAGLVTVDAGRADAGKAGPADAVGAPPPAEAAPPLSDREAQLAPAGEPETSIGAPEPAAQTAAEPGAVDTAPAEMPPMEPEAEASAEAPTAMEPTVTDVLAESVGVPAEAVAQDEAPVAPSPHAGDGAEPLPDAVADASVSRQEAGASVSRQEADASVSRQEAGAPVSRLEVPADDVEGGAPQEVGHDTAVPQNLQPAPGSEETRPELGVGQLHAEPSEAIRTADGRPSIEVPETVLARAVPDPRPIRPAADAAIEDAAAGDAAIADGEATLAAVVEQPTDVAVPARKPAAAVPAEAAPSTGDESQAPAEESAQDLAALPEPARRPSVAALDHVATNAGGSVARAYLTTGIRGREPVDTITESFNFPSEDGREFYYFTELRGLAGKTVVHRWELDGRFQGDVSFPVGSNRWRVYSTKTIGPRQDGVWTVSVRTTDGKLLADTEFVVRRQ